MRFSGKKNTAEFYFQVHKSRDNALKMALNWNFNKAAIWYQLDKLREFEHHDDLVFLREGCRGRVQNSQITAF